MKSYIFVFCVFILAGDLALAYPLSDHFDGKHFNNVPPVDGKGFFDFFRWVLAAGRKEWPDYVENKAVPQLAKNDDSNTIHVTFINHASSLIQIAGLNIITDPMFSERASPLSWLGPKRVRKPGMEISELPPIHYVMISHNHYDHLDLPSLRALDEKFHPHFLVPLGNATLLQDEGITNVTELDWWQSYSLGAKGNIHLVPCQHWSARGVFDRLETLWGAYVLEILSSRILFVGDAGYNSIYKTLYERFGAFDLSILPIGAYEPRWFMKDFHMNPEEAVQAHLDLHSRQSIASHFGTFQLTNEGIDDPPQSLSESLKLHKLRKEEFLVLEAGQTSTSLRIP